MTKSIRERMKEIDIEKHNDAIAKANTELQRKNEEHAIREEQKAIFEDAIAPLKELFRESVIELGQKWFPDITKRYPHYFFFIKTVKRPGYELQESMHLYQKCQRWVLFLSGGKWEAQFPGPTSKWEVNFPGQETLYQKGAVFFIFRDTSRNEICVGSDCDPSSSDWKCSQFNYLSASLKTKPLELSRENILNIVAQYYKYGPCRYNFWDHDGSHFHDIEYRIKNFK